MRSLINVINESKVGTPIKIEELINYVKKFYSEIQNDSEHRFRAWEDCYEAFQTEKNTNYLAKELDNYLAAWGMKRGSSFLLQKNWRIHLPVVEEIIKPKYNSLRGITCGELKKSENLQKLSELVSFMKSYYNKKRFEIKGTDRNVSQTLITKILLGTLGCSPAYDRYFISGIKELKISSQNFSTDSILRICDFYENNKEYFESARKEMKINNKIDYPIMKIIDMAIWQWQIEKATK